jgi:hypothetical protein
MPTDGDDARALELYKFAVELADRMSARRGTANAFFLTVQTTFLAVLGLATSNLSESPIWVTVAVTTAGLILSVTWWLQLRSYRDLNKAKFEVITDMETRLDISIFTGEWQSLKKDPVKKWRPRYAELGTAERLVPGVFAALYLVLLIVRLSH